MYLYLQDKLPSYAVNDKKSEHVLSLATLLKVILLPVMKRNIVIVSKVNKIIGLVPTLNDQYLNVHFIAVLRNCMLQAKNIKNNVLYAISKRQLQFP